MPDHLHALPAGHRLDEYRVDHVLGSGGFGITYYALDIHLNKPVAIKEYLPNDFALRTDATTVKPKSTSDQDDYQWGLERFLDEARALDGSVSAERLAMVPSGGVTAERSKRAAAGSKARNRRWIIRG